MKGRHELPASSPLAKVTDREIDDYVREYQRDPAFTAQTLVQLTRANPRFTLRALGIASDYASSENAHSPEADFMAGVAFIFDTLRRQVGREQFEREIVAALTGPETVIEDIATSDGVVLGLPPVA